jgi:putative oxidoreductase
MRLVDRAVVPRDPVHRVGRKEAHGRRSRAGTGLRALGLPDATMFAYLIGLCELVGGIAVVLGYPVRTASVLLGLWCLVTAYDAHWTNMTELLKM